MNRAVRNWWRGTRLHRWIQRNRADRWMPAPIGRWAPGGPVRLRVTDDVRPAVLDELTCAALWWCDLVGDHIFTVEPAGGVLLPERRGVVVSASPALDPEAEATTWMHRGPDGTFTDGDLRLPAAIPAARLTRDCRHELGHVLGLGDRPGGDPGLLMTNDGRGKGFELLPEEIEHVRSQWPQGGK